MKVLSAHIFSIFIDFLYMYLCVSLSFGLTYPGILLGWKYYIPCISIVNIFYPKNLPSQICRNPRISKERNFTRSHDWLSKKKFIKTYLISLLSKIQRHHKGPNDLKHFSIFHLSIVVSKLFFSLELAQQNFNSITHLSRACVMF